MTNGITALAVAALLALAVPSAASAAKRPHRTEQQAQNHIMKSIDSGTGSCSGRASDRPGTGLYHSFLCLATIWNLETGEQTAIAYRLDTRRHGKWKVRTLR